MGKIALLLSAPSYLVNWYSLTVGSFLTGIEKATASIVVMLVESVLLQLFLMVVLTKFMGVYGLFLVPSVGGLGAAVIAWMTWRRCVKKEFNSFRFGVK